MVEFEAWLLLRTVRKSRFESACYAVSEVDWGFEGCTIDRKISEEFP